MPAIRVLLVDDHKLFRAEMRGGSLLFGRYFNRNWI
jgi:hypothetical protein